MTFDKITYPPDLNVLRWAGEAVRQGQNIVFDAEKRYMRKDGTPLWVRVSGRSLIDEDENPGKLMLIIQNIAEQGGRGGRARKRSPAASDHDRGRRWHSADG